MYVLMYILLIVYVSSDKGKKISKLRPDDNAELITVSLHYMV